MEFKKLQIERVEPWPGSTCSFESNFRDFQHSCWRSYLESPRLPPIWLI